MTSDNRPDENFLVPEVDATEVPDDVDRRAFMMRSALVGAMAVITGCSPSNTAEKAAAAPAAAPPPVPDVKLSSDLNVVKKAKALV